MVRTEFYMTRGDGVDLYRTYSDEGFMIQKDGTDEVYSEAVDVDGIGYTYTETEYRIELTDSEALAILMGREVNEQA